MELSERVMADDQFRERYTLAEQLGVGGMGEVYKAFHKALNRPVAIKFLATELLRDPLYRERFTAEAQLASQLIHSNVVAVFDSGIASGVPYLITEFVPGQTLSSLMREKPEMDPATTFDLANQMLDGLAAIHRLGIVHRDIKPDNLLVTNGEPRLLKIADFGIAKGQPGQGGPQTAAGLMLGTPAYMAPEQVLGDPIKPPTDLYATGLIIYQLILNQHPFMGDEAFDVVRRQVHEEPLIPKELYKAVQSFLQRALAKRVADRFESAAEMKASLATFSEMVIAAGSWKREHATLSPSAPPPPEAQKWQLAESGVRKSVESGVTRLRAQQRQSGGASKDGALLAVPGGLATPATAGQMNDGAGFGSGVRGRAPMRPVAPERPAPRRGNGGLMLALAFGAVAAAGGIAFTQYPELFRAMKPASTSASAVPATVAPPAFSLPWTSPVRTLLAKRDPEAAAAFFRHAEREVGLSEMRFTDALVSELDQLLLEALDKLPTEIPEDAPAGLDKGPARRLWELATCLKGPLTPDSAKRFVATLALLEADMKGRPERLPAGHVLQRLGVAFQLVGASSNVEVTRDLEYLLIAGRSAPLIPGGAWSARLAEAVVGPLTPAGTSLEALATRKSLAVSETRERPRLAAALEWLEVELKATGGRVAAAPNPRCETRKRWLINEIMVRADSAARRRSSPDRWHVPASLPVERFHEIEGYPSDMLGRLDATLQRDGAISADSITLDNPFLADLARTLGCPPNLIKRVEEDETGCL